MERLPIVRNELGLTQRVSEVVKYYFDNPTLSQGDLAKHFGLSQGRISTILNHPKVLDAFPILAKRKLKGFVPEAIKRYGELMRQKDNPEVSRKVVERALTDGKVLDAPELTVKHKFEGMPVSKLVEFIKQSEAESAQIIDVEAVDESERK